MTPLVEFDRVSKGYGSDVPFRVLSLTISAGDRLALEGLDEGAAETLVHLVTGAALPDAGVVRVGGRDTRDIATDSEWLAVARSTRSREPSGGAHRRAARRCQSGVAAHARRRADVG